MGNLKGYVESYNEHSNKIVKAVGDPTMVYAVRGWIKDCRHFAEKAHNIAIKHLRNGGGVSEENSGRTLYEDDIEQLFVKRMDWTLRAERQNEELADKYGY